jgi:hypothetical protein
MKKLIIILVLAFGAVSCNNYVDCSCLMIWEANSVEPGYGYETTIYDTPEDECKDADSDIWNSDMKRIIKNLETHYVQYTLNCEPLTSL